MTEIDPCPLCGALPCDWVDNPHVAEASQTIKSLTARAEAAEAEVQRLTYNGIHTCHAECPRLPCVQRREIEALTARAEAAEARNKVLEEALDGVMIGGNHLALLIGADHPAYGTDHYAALEHYGAGDHYEAWCAWDAIMLARQALGGEHA